MSERHRDNSDTDSLFADISPGDAREKDAGDRGAQHQTESGAPRGYRYIPPLMLTTVFMIVLSAYSSVLVIRLANAPVLDLGQLIPMAVFAAALLLIGSMLRLTRYRGDGPLVAIAMLLCGLGIVVQVRIGTLQIGQNTAPSQYAFPLGVAAMMVVWIAFRNGRHRKLEKAWLAAWLVALAVIGVVIAFGSRYRGATYLKGNLNPVEIIKPLLVVFLAAVLVGHRQRLRRRFLGIPIPPLNVVATVMLLWMPPIVLLQVQSDMGMIVLLNLVALVMLYAVTRRLGYLLGGGALVILAARFAVPLSSHAMRRFEAWRDPFAAATGHGWQVLQGLVALYSGSWIGTGIGAGSPSVVPIVESDFVYIIFGEELGFVGCALLLLLYLALASRGFAIASRADNDFSSLLATGMTASIAVQTLVNIGGVTKAIPLTGITLPLISHGGSSLVTTMAMIGLLMALSEPHAKTKSDKGGTR